MSDKICCNLQFCRAWPFRSSGRFPGDRRRFLIWVPLLSRCFFAASEIPCAAARLSYRQETVALCFLLV